MSLYPEKELKRIGDLLDSRFKEPDPVPLPKATENYGNAIRLYFDKLNVAYSKYSMKLDSIEQYKGSPYYESAEQSAKAEYEASAESAKRDTIGLIGESIEQLRQNYVALTQKSIPADVMQQMQVFNMLKHPTADQYERYQEAFRGYPSAMEVLCNKYDEEAKPAKEMGKDEYGFNAEVLVSKGYVPRYKTSTPFCPTRPLTYGDVNALLGRLSKNAENIFATNLPGELAATEFSKRGGYANAAVVRGVMKAKTPEDIMSAVALANDGEISDFLHQVDTNYKPSTKLYTQPEEIPSIDTSNPAAESISARFAKQRTEQETQRQKTIDYYTKNPNS
jgi:hypothetical protein